MRKYGVCLVFIFSAFFLLGSFPWVTDAAAGQLGMNILTKGLQILKEEMSGQPAHSADDSDNIPPGDGSAVFNNSAASSDVQVNLGNGLKAFLSAGAPRPDFDGRDTRNYGATIGISIPY